MRAAQGPSPPGRHCRRGSDRRARPRRRTVRPERGHGMAAGPTGQRRNMRQARLASRSDSPPCRVCNRAVELHSILEKRKNDCSTELASSRTFNSSTCRSGGSRAGPGRRDQGALPDRPSDSAHLPRLRQLDLFGDDNALIFLDRTPKGRHYTTRPGGPPTRLQDSSFGAGCLGNFRCS